MRESTCIPIFGLLCLCVRVCMVQSAYVCTHTNIHTYKHTQHAHIQDDFEGHHDMRNRWRQKARHRYYRAHGIAIPGKERGKPRRTAWSIDGKTKKRTAANQGHDMLIAIRRFIQRNGNVEDSWSKRRPGHATYSGVGFVPGPGRPLGKFLPGLNFGDGEAGKKLRTHPKKSVDSDVFGPKTKKRKKRSFDDQPPQQ